MKTNKAVQIILKIFSCIVPFMVYGLAAAFDNIFFTVFFF